MSGNSLVTSQPQDVSLGGWLAERRAVKQVHRAQLAAAVETARGNAQIGAIRDVTQSAVLAASDICTVEAALVAKTTHPGFAHDAAYLRTKGVVAMGEVIDKVAR